MADKTFVTRSDFYQEFNTSQNQFLYFLIGLNVAGIGFILSKLDHRTLAWSLLPGGVAVVCWALSAWLGICFIQDKKAGILREIQHMDSLEDDPSSPEGRAGRESLAQKAVKGQVISQRQYDAMYYLLFAGVICCIGWIGYELLLRSL